MTVGVENLIFRYLDTDGDGSGTKNAIGDYSVTPTDFYIQDATANIHLNRMLVTVEDSGAFDAEHYGNGVTLTNGIKVSVTDAEDNELIDLTDGLVIHTNADWGRQCYDVDVKTWGTGDEVALVRWTFDRTGHPLIITRNKKLKVTLNDDLTALVGHFFQVQGWRIPRATA